MGGFFSRLLCALGFPFYLGPLSPVYLLVTAQGLAAYSCFTTQSFWYSVLGNWVFSSLSFGTFFEFWQVSGLFRSFVTFNFLARFHFSVSYSGSVKGTVANSSMLFFAKGLHVNMKLKNNASE